MWVHVLRGLAIAILGVLTLGCGVCSMFFLPASLWDIAQHGRGNYRELPLFMSVIGLAVALVSGWILRRLWRLGTSSTDRSAVGTRTDNRTQA